MILPKKQIKLSESLFALGAVILSNIKRCTSVDQIWNKIGEHLIVAQLIDNKGKIISQKDLKVKFTFDSFILTLDYLYTIGSIDIDEKGDIFRCI